MAAVIKSGRGLAVKLPGYITDSLSLKEGDEIEFGMVDSETASMKKLKNVSAKELDVLKKINSIKFSERTKEAVEKLLSTDEKNVLKGLMKKNIVSFYDKGKYKGKGVYSISRDYYYLITQQKPKELNKGFLVVDDFEKAMTTMEELKPQIQKGNVLSVRAFDKKFYFVSSDIVDSLGSELVALLSEKDFTTEELSEKMKTRKELIRAVLEILRESGDVIEKKKELYSLA